MIILALVFLTGLLIGGFATLGAVVWLEQESDRVRGVLRRNLVDDQAPEPFYVRRTVNTDRAQERVH